MNATLNHSHPNLPGDLLPSAPLVVPLPPVTVTRPRPEGGQVVRVEARDDAVNERNAAIVDRLRKLERVRWREQNEAWQEWGIQRTQESRHAAELAEERWQELKSILEP